MDKRKIRDYFKLVFALLLIIIYIPHIFVYLTDNKRQILSDVNSMLTRIPIKIPTFLGFIFLIHTNRYFRTLFYYRSGPIIASIIGWWRPGDRYFIISKTTKMGNAIMFAHPYCTILNAERIGDNFNFRHLTTLGDKNGKRPIIGNNVNLGANVTIIGGITIGNNVTVGAGSVVVKDVPDNCIIAGNPTKIIKYVNK